MNFMSPYFFPAQPLNQLRVFGVSWVQKAAKAQMRVKDITSIQRLNMKVLYPR